MDKLFCDNVTDRIMNFIKKELKSRRKSIMAIFIKKDGLVNGRIEFLV